MQLTAQDVRQVAELARLELTEAEFPEMAQQLNEIVAFVEQLRQIDTTGVEPLAHPLPVRNVFRGDVPSASLPVGDALANAPATQDEFFTVPAVFE